MPQCAICLRLTEIRMNGDPALVHEFPHSYLLLGNHQYYPGYCILLYKEHVRELHELAPVIQDELNRELMVATTAIARAFHPWKINHACLGNRDQHIHWHIIPRYETEADHHYDPWKHADEFPNYVISAKQQQEVAAIIRCHIP